MIIEGEDFQKMTMGNSVKIIIFDSLYKESIERSIKNMNPLPSLFTITEVMDFWMKSTKAFSLCSVSDVVNHIPLILYTSGSTGDPKGIPVSNLSLQRYGYL